MSLNRLHLILIATWFTILTGVLGSCLALGVSLTLSQVALLVGLACIPPLILLVVFRGAPHRSLGGMLYDTERSESGHATRRQD